MLLFHKAGDPMAQKSATLSSVSEEGIKDEYGDYAIYQALAKSHRNGRRSQRQKLAPIFQTLSDTEYRHYEFWKKYSPNTEARVSKAKLYSLIVLEKILGATFAIKFLERHEKATIKEYEAIEQYIPPEDRAKFEEMLRDEEEHEASLAKQVQSSFVIYMSFVVLGLADAIVEISGIHAGSLGIYSSTELTGLAGVIAGAAASMAMASAAYAQAKQGFQGRAGISAAMTGVSYFVSAILLASPYFLTKDAILAMSVSLVIAVIILAFTNYYNSIISGANFLRDFLELAGIMFGATVLLLLLGEVIRHALGITI
jgi:vacuolar iron transporter family protein